jgi:16S rRNA (cytidine1402-2'-O)-methyltransferase
MAERNRVRGEITLLVEAKPLSEFGSDARTNATAEKISTRVARLQAECGMDEKEALKRLAKELGNSKSELYRALQRERARLRS